VAIRRRRRSKEEENTAATCNELPCWAAIMTTTSPYEGDLHVGKRLNGASERASTEADGE